MGQLLFVVLLLLLLLLTDVSADEDGVGGNKKKGSKKRGNKKKQQTQQDQNQNVEERNEAVDVKAAEEQPFAYHVTDETIRKQMENRLTNYYEQAQKLVLIHVHIPKAGGTALAYALAGSCNCTSNALAPNAAKVCRQCREVHGRSGARFTCTKSRVTGWPCELAHAPIALLKQLPDCQAVRPLRAANGLGPRNLVFYGFKFMLVTMLRRPYERFLSEVKHFSGFRYQTLDWGVVVVPPPTPGTDPGRVPAFYANTTLYYPGVAPPASPLGASVLEVANLPSEIMAHNRYTKMIGGAINEFNLSYVKKDMGSRWLGVDGSNSMQMRKDGLLTDNKNGVDGQHQRQQQYVKVFRRAMNMLARSEELLPLLFERFGDSLCVLEVAVGHLQKFPWQSSVHTHPHSGQGVNFSVASSADSLASANTIEDERSLDSAAYKAWATKNQADLALYAHAERVFNIQLDVAVRLLRDRITSGLVSLEKAQSHAPHCLESSAWRYLVDLKPRGNAAS